MKLPSYVKPCPKILNSIYARFYNGNSFYPYIIVNRQIYDDLKEDNPKPESLATLFHEEKHKERQKNQRLFIFGLKYLFNRKYRFNEEFEAYKITMQVYRQNNISFNIDMKARQLSGLIYLWSISYEDAKETLENYWGSL